MEMEKLKSHLLQIRETLYAANVQFRALNSRIVAKSGPDSEDESSLKTDQGISLLELKIHTLNQYVRYLAYFIMLKAEGVSVVDHLVIDRLTELRLTLEKLKPIEQKLQYQIEKLVKLANSDTQQDSTELVPEALSFKPDLSGMLAQEQEPNSDKASQEVVTKYKASKIAPVFFDEDAPKSKAAKRLRDQERQIERTRHRAASSRMIRDLMSQYDERPEESATTGLDVDYQRLADADKNIARYREKIAFEEDNFTRLPTTRKDKKALRDMQKESYKAADELRQLDKDFSDVMNLDRLVKDNEKSTRVGNKGVIERRNKRRLQANEAGENELEKEVTATQNRSTKSAGLGFENKARLTAKRMAAFERKRARKSNS